MLHEPVVHDPADEHASREKARLGVWMFLPYAAVYVGFILINVLSPQSMGIEILMGLNLAIVYGFGLIFLAIIMALIYTRLCGRLEKKAREEAERTSLTEKLPETFEQTTKAGAQ